MTPTPLLELAKEPPVEEAPGRPLEALALFDATSGYQESRVLELPELSLAAYRGLATENRAGEAGRAAIAL